MNNKYLFIIIFLLILFPPNINNIRLNIKIIIALIGIIIICNVNEGFGNIDAEALQNMASLYNSSTGVLKVNNLEASGNVKVTGDIEASGNVKATGDIEASGNVKATGNIKSDKISTITAGGYISTNLVKPTVKTEHLNILGPNDQKIILTNGQYIDLINTNVHIDGNRKPGNAGQGPDNYKLYVSMPSEFRKEINGNNSVATFKRIKLTQRASNIWRDAANSAEAAPITLTNADHIRDSMFIKSCSPKINDNEPNHGLDMWGRPQNLKDSAIKGCED